MAFPIYDESKGKHETWVSIKTIMLTSTKENAADSTSVVLVE